MSSHRLPDVEWPASLPGQHRRLLTSILEGLERDADVLGVAAGGSFATDAMDEQSDLDLVVVVTPGSWPGILERRKEIAASLGPLAAAFTGEHVGEPRLLVTLYGPPPVHVDLKFVIPDALAQRVEDPVVLWDRDGSVRDGLANGTARYPAPDLQWIEDRFWVWVHYAASKGARGEVYELLDALSFLRGKVFGPLLLRAAQLQPNGVRRVESSDAAWLHGLETTVAKYDAADGLRAVGAAVILYRALREQLPDHIERRDAAEALAVQYLAEAMRA